jgi:hypothetical protein
MKKKGHVKKKEERQRATKRERQSATCVSKLVMRKRGNAKEGKRVEKTKCDGERRDKERRENEKEGKKKERGKHKSNQIKSNQHLTFNEKKNLKGQKAEWRAEV